MDIREINELDTAEYSQLYVDVFNAEPWNENWSLASASERLNCYRNTPNFIGVCAREDSALLGFIFGNFEPYRNGKVYLLKEMCVQPVYQGHGIGTRLLEILHLKLADKNIDLVNLLTREGQPAESFYLKNGYKKSSRMGLYFAKLNT